MMSSGDPHAFLFTGGLEYIFFEFVLNFCIMFTSFWFFTYLRSFTSTKNFLSRIIFLMSGNLFTVTELSIKNEITLFLARLCLFTRLLANAFPARAMFFKLS